MGVSLTKQRDSNGFNANLCYFPKDSSPKWAFAESITLIDLDKPASWNQLYYTEKDLSKYDIYFLRPMPENSFPTVPLYSIQGSSTLQKALPSDIKLSDIDEEIYSSGDLIPAESKRLSMKNVYILEVKDSEIFYNKATIRQNIKDVLNIKIPNNFEYIFVWLNYNSEKTLTKLTPENLPHDVNTNLGITINDIVPEEYPFHFLHSTNDFKSVLRTGRICNFGRCSVDFFDESTGEYLFPNIQVNAYNPVPLPGIYMEYLDVSDLVTPLAKESIFKVISIDTVATSFGPIGFIFPLEEVFKYHVNLKRGIYYGRGKNIDLKDFYSLGEKSEIIVRANYIEISKASALHVLFSAIELKFIYDYFPNVLGINIKNITLQDVIDLYTGDIVSKHKLEENEPADSQDLEERPSDVHGNAQSRSADSHWYIRKSNFKKVIDSYQALGLELPLIFCNRTKHDSTDTVYNTVFDTDSESESILLAH